ncbi:MAG: HD domain-containing protein [Deltaproteobacteria bacterium]|nr:HD domain-containing protein [Deltaproteobacteria bacterium]
MMEIQDIIKELDGLERQRLSRFATPSGQGIRRKPQKTAGEDDYRQSFSLDVDRILHSQAYTRYIDKTQVFSLIKNDHITHRVLHVQLVSKIARTIGRFLRLNEDLIEAIALGHDIGHTPFGHDGERFLTDICHEHGIGHFHHNVQSVQFLDRVERGGEGWNLCLQTLDGILCHDGEIHNQSLEPIKDKNFEKLDKDILKMKRNSVLKLIPMTLEGCVVRIADTISYIGRDIEDAIRLNIIRRGDLPGTSVERLGDTNGTIVFNLVTDVIQHSIGRNRISFSTDVSDALQLLKQFNLEQIYLNPKTKKESKKIKALFEYLFERFLKDLERQNINSVIFQGFLNGKSDDYLNGHKREEIVRDFIAGMTDRFFLRQAPAHMRPHLVDYH